MKTSDFDYYLPASLIATNPISPRDHSRLLVLDKKTGKMEHKYFYDIVDYLNPGDILVVNNSKVIPARLWARKAGSGGKVEVLLHKKIDNNVWECLLRGRVKEKTFLFFKKNLNAEILKNNEDGTWNLRFNKKGKELMEIFSKIGEVPLPPYIIKQREKQRDCHVATVPRKKVNCGAREATLGYDIKDYQTVYAADDKKGSVAAPTAGLHFTPPLLKKIKAKGIKILEITLYVGMGTFAPVKVEDFKKHKMHAEWVEINRRAIDQLRIKNYLAYRQAGELKIKGEKNKIIAVGTTSCRALEACFSNLPKTGGFKNWVDIFIYPGYKFKAVDAMITNFHLPKSTLLMLVSALAGKKNIDKAYKEAIKKKYRFYSYGDAMLIV